VAKYHLFFLRNGMLVGSGEVEAADEQEATQIAKQQGEGEVVEVWSDHERVNVVPTA
jgi:uncharacterized protein YheU (UPF0270 family)